MTSLNSKSIADTLPFSQHKVAKAVLMACCLLLFTHSISSDANDANDATDRSIALTSQTLFYAVKIRRVYAGKLEIVIEHSEEQIKTTAITHFNWAARLASVTNTVIETWFNIENGKVYLNRGHTLSSNRKVVERRFAIDWQQTQIKFEPEGKQILIDAADIFESVAFPIALITSDIDLIAGQTVQETDSKDINEYVYSAPLQQTLELNGRKFETWKVTRHKPNNPTRTVTVWLDRNNQQIPLKIITRKKGKDTVITLLSKS